MIKKIALLMIPCILISCAGTQVKSSSKEMQQQKAQEAFKELGGDDNSLEEDTQKKNESIEVNERNSPQSGYPLKDGYPVWYYTPDYEGRMGAVGIAKPQARGGYEAQKRVAVAIAQAELARQIEVMVNAVVETEKRMVDTQTEQGYNSNLSSLSIQKSQQLIKDAAVADEWIDPKTGNLYVWVVIEKCP